jgi:hypothetical protein
MYTFASHHNIQQDQRILNLFNDGKYCLNNSENQKSSSRKNRNNCPWGAKVIAHQQSTPSWKPAPVILVHVLAQL